jgi:Peptidase MA superfamily
MTTMRVPRLLLALAFVSGLLLVAPAGALADDVSFGKPDATAAYDDSITFTVDVTRSVPLDRVELRLRFPDSLGPVIVDVPAPPGTGTDTLEYVLDLSGGGHIVPNTPIVATWAAFTEPGATAVTSSDQTVNYQDTTHDWRTVKGDLMTVHWYEGGQAFANKALRIGDQAIKDTATLLGVDETEPVDFYIYGDEASFRKALGPGTRENVGGQAHADIRTLFALITPNEIDDAWVGIVIPHELVHLVFDTAVHNPYRFPPRWLNEGLAVYLSEGYGSSDRGRVENATQSQELIPLVALGGQFPTDYDRTLLAYAESVSAIDYIVRTQSQDALVSLVNAYADGLTDDEAFTRALGVDLAAFQAGWLADLGATDPEQYGPQPAPAGPLPSGWTGSAATPDAVGSPGASLGTAAPGAATALPTTPDETPVVVTAPVTAASGSNLGLLALIVIGILVAVVVIAALARRRITTI